MRSCMWRMARLFKTMTVVGAIGGILAAPAALAQAASSQKSAKAAPAAKPVAAAKPGAVGGVTVQSPRQRPSLAKVPPDKAAAYDEEVRKSEAWKSYRKSTPPASAGTLGQSKDYPGLQTLLPPKN